ncbi:MAG: oligosaccharide flippase family protein [Chloroflexi bacterium]|nr:oligosaccharide flippase family protein [Chloroflexota bacterium]
MAELLSSDSAFQGYLAAFDQGTISLTNFAASIILARAISPTEFGMYGVGFLLLLLLRAVQEGLTVQPLNAIGPTLEGDEYRRYASSTAVLQLILSALTALGAFALGWVLTATGNDVAGPTVAAMAFVGSVWQIQEFLRRGFYARGRVGAAALNTGLASLVRLGVLVLMVHGGGLSARAGLDAIAYGSLAAGVVGVIQFSESWTRAGLDVRGVLRTNWSFGRWVSGGSIANWAALEIYPILSAGMISFAAAGALRALQNLVAPIHVLLRTLETYLTPRAARRFKVGGWGGLRALLSRVYWLSVLPAIALLAGVSLFPAPLMRLLYGEKYAGYSGMLPLLALAYGLWFAYAPLQACFKAIPWTRPVFLANALATLSIFTIGLLAIHFFGLAGAIGGQALNGLLIGAVLWIVWWRAPRQGAPAA